MVEARIVLTAVALLGAMIVCAMIGWRQTHGGILLMLLSFVWLSDDRQWELGLLFRLDSQHGVVTSDLVGALGFILGMSEVFVGWRRLRGTTGASTRHRATSQKWLSRSRLARTKPHNDATARRRRIYRSGASHGTVARSAATLAADVDRVAR